ncbi:single-stranded DNA-binding protein [Actinomyces sp. MRS3W]|uniref:single-stranded DNA-binding protein n=1 Tax=Actinomyces sp. MRS3W TaxID=2800796 RepID=UPI0028FD5AB2|nr:single-stranded DNA-binding protein [Actinomyces sp. MRS3W]MDU0349416.1 single-stranded DNA-binding protein [Actinomyces sp. MRS3W]
MSRQLDLIVQGVLGTNPVVTRTSNGRAYCYFRLATSPSFRTAEGWQDGQTIWFTAKSWGALAENLARSLHKGDPVVLVGRFTQESWAKGSEEHITNVLTISCGGHDLTRGESRFMRIAHAPDAAQGSESDETTPTTSAGSAGSAPTPDEARPQLAAPSDAQPDAHPAVQADPMTPAPLQAPMPSSTPTAQPPQASTAARPPMLETATSPEALDYVLADERDD